MFRFQRVCKLLPYKQEWCSQASTWNIRHRELCETLGWEKQVNRQVVSFSLSSLKTEHFCCHHFYLDLLIYHSAVCTAGAGWGEVRLCTGHYYYRSADLHMLLGTHTAVWKVTEFWTTDGKKFSSQCTRKSRRNGIYGEIHLQSKIRQMF